MAIDGKVDWVKKTNPWGSAEEESKEAPPANVVANQLRSFLGAREKVG